ncbi:hypothetical protein P168DRAFT_16075 [Aspergillus campestris IBT 28561]|uniref:Secreted protein n=1 Tax=Aspergillus campestris (strain IBT 28561) TaxID=1392248 RepID=A0A2I1DEX6_ASPC2|nr:uncharacterized protein P168DRAFT_16075 [Aspergillus campestris IBT 28561]PKY08400.1 hypothetical protein P168DRAFT_16075 [Aspergillus campestris IBT 28561]
MMFMPFYVLICLFLFSSHLFPPFPFCLIFEDCTKIIYWSLHGISLLPRGLVWMHLIPWLPRRPVL